MKKKRKGARKLTPLQRLIASGRATAPKGDLLEAVRHFGRLPDRRLRMSLARALEEEREERL